MPSSSVRRRTRLHSSRSAGSPQMPAPVRRMAPKPKRFTVKSPPRSIVPASAALMVVVRSAMTSSSWCSAVVNSRRRSGYDATVKIGVILPYEGGLPFADALEMTQRAEALGFDSVWIPEAWGTDAISLLGALAARTERIRLGTGIVNVFSRTPTLLGQTAATLDLISKGRFILGLGTSGHQVVSGWPGMRFDRPPHGNRETVEIVRRVLRQERLRFDGEIFTLDQGLKLLARPVRPAVPIFLATLTPAGLRLTRGDAHGWVPTVVPPHHLDQFRPPLGAGGTP